MRRVILCAVVVMGLCGASVSSEITYYVGPDGGSWHTAENWSLGRIPLGARIGGDHVRIFNNLTVRITADVPDEFRLNTLTVGYSRDGGIIQESGNLEVSSITMGRRDGSNENMGTYTLEDGSIVIGGSLNVGGSNRDNTFIMNSGSISIGSYLWIGGDGGVNRFTMNNGDMMVGSLSLRSGVYNLEGGTLTLRNRIEFGSGVTKNRYFNFGRGVMNLPGDWDFDRLVSIGESDFRVLGNPVTEGDLQFGDLFLIGNEIFTAISGIPKSPAVVRRHVFYNNSLFDLPLIGRTDDDAVAPDKQALLPGETATVSNYTSYHKGINGIMVDIDGLAGTPTALDFDFKVGNDDNPDLWGDAPDPIDVIVRAGEGVDGSDRIAILWDDNAIDNEWLQIILRATDVTGLLEDDVFYFGNAIGESGNSTTDAIVDAFDILGARDNPRTFPDAAPIDFAFDYDRDAEVNAADVIISRNNPTTFFNALQLITVPGAKAIPVPEPSTLALLAMGAIGLLSYVWRQQ
ncbi:hypothetical protein LCGC14_2037930, partial [marine sediment metagenome]